MMSEARKQAEALVDRLEQVFLKAEKMRRGGNLDKLLLEEIEGFDRELYERIARHRQETQAAHEAAFPPCGGVSSLREGDASSALEETDAPDVAR